MNLLDRIQPKWKLEFSSTFPWGKYEAIAIRSPTIRILCGFRSFPDRQKGEKQINDDLCFHDKGDYD